MPGALWQTVCIRRLRMGIAFQLCGCLELEDSARTLLYELLAPIPQNRAHLYPMIPTIPYTPENVDLHPILPILRYWGGGDPGV